MNNASMMISAIFDRKKEIEEIMNKNNVDSNEDGTIIQKERDQKFKVDPFFLLREVAEMSNLQNLQKKDNLLSNEQLMARQNYNNMVQSNFEKQVNDNTIQNFDPNSIQEKMKKLRFVKKDELPSNKDSNWFQKLSQIAPNSKNEIQETEIKRQKLLNMKIGLSQEDERKIQREMIPFFQQKQDELKPEYENLKNIGKELKQLQEQFGVVLKQVPPQATTSFMNRRGSQARQYEQLTNQLRMNRAQKQIEKTNEKVLSSLITSGQVSRQELYSQSKLEFNQKNSKNNEKNQEDTMKQEQNGNNSQLQTETAIDSMPPQYTQFENGEDNLKNTEKMSEISSYNRPQEDDRICKQCGYFGCQGTCISQANNQNTYQNHEDLYDQGQAFIKNNYGLIDLTKTEYLFKKRGEVDPNIIENNMLEDEEEKCTQKLKQQEQEQIKQINCSKPANNKSKIQKMNKNIQLSKDPAILKQLKSFKPENSKKLMDKISPQKNQTLIRKDSLNLIGKQSRLKENLNEYFSQNIIKSQNSNIYVTNGININQQQKKMISEGYTTSIVAKRSLVKISRNDDLTYLQQTKSNNNEFQSPSADINSLQTGIQEDMSINKERLFSCGGVSTKQSQYFSNNQDIHKQMKTSQNFMSKQKNRIIMQGIQNQRLSEVAFDGGKNKKYIQNIRNIQQDERNSSFNNEKIKLQSLNQRKKRNREGDQFEIKTAQDQSQGTFCFSAGAAQQTEDKFITKNESTDEEVCQGIELKNLKNDNNQKGSKQANYEFKKHLKQLNKQKNKEIMNQDELEQQNLMKYLKKKNKVLKKQLQRQQESSQKPEKEGKIKQIPSLRQLQQLINSQLKLEQLKLKNKMKKRDEIEEAYGEDAYNCKILNKKISNQRLNSSQKRDNSSGGRTSFKNINFIKQEVFSQPQKNECFSQGEYRPIKKDKSFKNIEAKNDLIEDRIISPQINKQCSSVSSSIDNQSIEQKAKSINQINFRKIQSNIKTLDLTKKYKQVLMNDEQNMKSGRIISSRDNKKYETCEYQQSLPQSKVDSIKHEIRMPNLQRIQNFNKDNIKHNNEQKNVLSPISANQSFQNLLLNVEQQNMNNIIEKNPQSISNQYSFNKDAQIDFINKKSQKYGKMLQTDAQISIRKQNLISLNNEQKSVKSQTLNYESQEKNNENFIKEFEGTDILNKNDYEEIIKWQKNKKKFEKTYVQRQNISNSMIDNSQKLKFSLGKDSQTIAGFQDVVNINYDNGHGQEQHKKFVLSQVYSSNDENRFNKEIGQFPKFVKSVKETKRIDSNMVQNFGNVKRVKISEDNSNLVQEQFQLRQLDRFKNKGDQFLKSNENNLNLRAKQLNSNIIKSKSIFPQFTKSVLNPLMYKNSLNQENFDDMKKEKRKNAKNSFALTAKEQMKKYNQIKSPDTLNDLDTMRVARKILNKDIFNDVSILNPMVRNINSQNYRNMQVQRTQLISPMQMAGNILQPAFPQVLQSQEIFRDGKVQSSLNTIQSVADVYMRASTIIKDKKSIGRASINNQSITHSINQKEIQQSHNRHDSLNDKLPFTQSNTSKQRSIKDKQTFQNIEIENNKKEKEIKIVQQNDSIINKLSNMPENTQQTNENKIYEQKQINNKIIQEKDEIIDRNNIKEDNENETNIINLIKQQNEVINSVASSSKMQQQIQNHDSNQVTQLLPNNQYNQSVITQTNNNLFDGNQSKNLLRLNLNIGQQVFNQEQNKGITFSKKEFKTESMSHRNSTYKQIFTNNLAQNKLNFSNYESTDVFKQNNFDHQSSVKRNLYNQSDFKNQQSLSKHEKKQKENEIAFLNNFGKKIIQGSVPLKSKMKELIILSKKIQINNQQKISNQDLFQQQTNQLIKKQKNRKSRNDYLQEEGSKSRDQVVSQLSQSQAARLKFEERVQSGSKNIFKNREQNTHSKLLDTSFKNQMLSVDDKNQIYSKKDIVSKQFHQLSNLQLRKSCQNIMMIQNQEFSKEAQQKLETLIQQKRSLGQLLSLKYEQNSGRKKFKQSSKKTPIRIVSNRNLKNGMESSNKSHVTSNPFQIYTQGINQQYINLIKSSGFIQALASQTSLPIQKKKKKTKKGKKKHHEQSTEQNPNDQNNQLKKHIFSSDEATEEEDEEDCQSQHEQQNNNQ